jgi:ATP-binding cassette subfamily C protein CydC
MRDLLRIITVARSQWGWLLLGIFAGVGVIAANSLLMAVSGWFIASMAVAGITKVSFNFFAPSAAIRALAISRTVGRYLERLITHGAALRLLSELRVWLFIKFAPLSPGVLERYSSGELAARLRGDIDSLENLYIRVVAPLAAGAVAIVAAALFVAIWSPAAAGALLFFLLVSGLLLPFLAKHLAQPHGKESARLSGELRRVVTDGIAGGDELILLGAVEMHVQKVAALSAELVAEQKSLAEKGAIISAGSLLSAGTGVAAVLMLASLAVISGEIEGPHLVMLLLFSAAAFEAAGGMAAAMLHYPAAAESARRIVELSGAVPSVAEPLTAAAAPSEFSLNCRSVNFSYGENKVLNDFALQIPAGGRVALVGPSGSGKSSVAEILLRFREYEGSISFGGRELKEYAADELRCFISALPQKPHLFNSTIRENIIVANPEASAAEIADVVYAAVLDAWVSTLPQGLETRVGEGGSEISGGEARRIALARALLKDVPFYILDEPTEGLDAVTEQQLLVRLDKRLTGKSLLLITHRPAPLAIVDRVVRMETACA